MKYTIEFDNKEELLAALESAEVPGLRQQVQDLEALVSLQVAQLSEKDALHREAVLALEQQHQENTKTLRDQIERMKRRQEAAAE